MKGTIRSLTSDIAAGLEGFFCMLIMMSNGKMGERGRRVGKQKDEYWALELEMIFINLIIFARS